MMAAATEARPADTPTLPDASAASPSAEARLGRMFVLVCGGDAAARALVRSTLRPRAFHLVEVDRAREVPTLRWCGAADAVLLLGCDAGALDDVRLLRERAPHLPVVVLSEPLEEVDRELIAAGAQDLLAPAEAATRLGRALRHAVVRHRTVTRLQRNTYNDPLTGVLNRRGFHARAGRLLAEADRRGCEAVLLYVDVDELKHVNDRYGHPAGDRLLQDAAVVLRTAVRGDDLVARVGGDEFVVLAVAPPREGPSLSARVFEAARDFNERRTGLVPLAFSVGAAAYRPGSALSLADLLAEADRRMYRCKAEALLEG
ncbi:MAG: diguanylate cyclase, partial [Gemmatimonadetes bacterium]